jgi:hypothetical protein
VRQYTRRSPEPVERLHHHFVNSLSHWIAHSPRA